MPSFFNPDDTARAFSWSGRDEEAKTCSQELRKSGGRPTRSWAARWPVRTRARGSPPPAKSATPFSRGNRPGLPLCGEPAGYGRVHRSTEPMVPFTQAAVYMVWLIPIISPERQFFGCRKYSVTLSSPHRSGPIPDGAPSRPVSLSIFRPPRPEEGTSFLGPGLFPVLPDSLHRHFDPPVRPHLQKQASRTNRPIPRSRRRRPADGLRWPLPPFPTIGAV